MHAACTLQFMCLSYVHSQVEYVLITTFNQSSATVHNAHLLILLVAVEGQWHMHGSTNNTLQT